MVLQSLLGGIFNCKIMSLTKTGKFVKCLICSKEFYVQRYRIIKGKPLYCSNKCYGIGRIKMNLKPWNKNLKGIHLSPKTEFKIGIIPWNKGTNGLMAIPWNKGKENVMPSGKNHHQWKGGINIYNNRCFILNPNHPYGHKGYVRRSRLIAEKILERWLEPEEIIHHINRNSLDDRPENLYLFSSNSNHRKFGHSKNKPILKSNLI